MSGRHVFRLAPTPYREITRWRCSRCGVRRRRVVPVAMGHWAALPLRSFWLYRVGGGAWTNQQPACTGLRA